MDTNSPEGQVKALLTEQGMGEHDAGILAFDFIWAADVSDAEDALREALAKREDYIRRVANAGLSYRQIGRFTGLSHQRIAQIVTGANDG